MSDQDFYYSDRGERIPLRRSRTALAICYQEDLPPKDLMALVRGDDQLYQFVTSPELERRNIVIYKRRAGARSTLQEFALRVAESPRVRFAVPVYYQEDTALLVTDELIACFKPEVSRRRIDEWNAAHGVVILPSPGIDLGPNTWRLRIEDPKIHYALEVSRRLFESGLVEYSEPDFCHLTFVEMPFVPNDPLFSEQWHLTRIQAPDAWEISRGDPDVTVAVIDQGIDLDHEDLASAGKFVAARDLFNVPPDNNPRPVATGENHGTMVAGVAVANGHNSLGVSGIAPGCRLMPIRLLSSGANALPASLRSAAIRHAANNGAAVITNSWGSRAPLDTTTRRAIEHATDNGRGGKGCVIFFAAGNQNAQVANRAEASYVRTVAVSACNDQDVRSAYSNFGPEVDLCAPSDGTSSDEDGWRARLQAFGATFRHDGSTRRIFTTDRMGNAGENPPASGSDPSSDVNYTGNFGGTSAACPLTAGVAALMLSVKPDLTWQQVCYVLEATADKIDLGNNDPVGRYRDGHSRWYGFGRVNALQAVEGARAAEPLDRVTVTLRRREGHRFVSTQAVRAIDARRPRAATAVTAFLRTAPKGSVNTGLQVGPLTLSAEVEVDEEDPRT